MTYRVRLASPTLPLLRNDVSRLFDEVFTLPAPRRGWSAGTDLRETETGYVLSLDVPGIPSEQLELSVEGRTLTIAGERSDRPGTKVRHSFQLPEGTDAEGISAQLAHGVLTVTIAKPVTAQPRRIAVTAA